MLQEMPIGCRLGPRCPFAQKMYQQTAISESKTARVCLPFSD